MKRKNIGIFTGVLLSAFAALNLNAAAIKTGTSAPKMKPVLTVEYEYSRSGQIIGRKINGRKQSYKYDKKGQLLGVYDEKGNAVEEYVYDPAGNILKKTIHGRTTTYKYDKANQLVSSECNKEVTKYEYDAAGRLVKEGDKVYSYIGLDKIESVTEGGRKLSSFTYHIDGQLAARVSIESSETFHWDGLALIQRNSTSYVNEPAVTGGNPILADDKILFNDMLGTTLGVKDGDKVTQNSLTAFGESLSTSPMQDSFFTGKPHVGEMGYVFLFRAYRADQGKWQTADPLGYPDGWNNFAYVNNGVISYIDCLGAWSYQFIGNWSNAEKNLFNSYMTSITQALNNVIVDINNYLTKATSCPKCEQTILGHINEVQNLLEILRSTQNKINSNDILELRKVDLGSQTYASINIAPLYGNQYMNLNINSSFNNIYNFFSPRSTEMAKDSLFHENTHAGGSQDNNIWWQSAETMGGLANHSFFKIYGSYLQCQCE